jgi:hypothetical protein
MKGSQLYHFLKCFSAGPGVFPDEKLPTVSLSELFQLDQVYSQMKGSQLYHCLNFFFSWTRCIPR